MTDTGAMLLAFARAAGARSLAVVGTSKNAGKSVTIGAVCTALERAAIPFGLCSIGRDGEAADVLEAHAKPRFFMRPGTLFATAATLVTRAPAVEIVALREERSALGPIVIGRVRRAGFVEIVGPPSATALRRIANALASDGRFVLVDGAVDRIAALRDGDDAIVVAVGAAGAATIEHAADDAAGLVARLRLPPADPAAPALAIDGALTAGHAAELLRAGERRQIVVRDATRVAFGGRTFLELAARLDLRCERRLHPVACTVASRSAARTFEPRAFARAVAERTGLPTLDVFAGTVTEPRAA